MPPHVMTVEEKIQELENRILALTTISSPDTRIKARTPDEFDGTPSKFNTFKQQLYLYYGARPKDFLTVQPKVIFALSYMRGGTAGPWAEMTIEKISDWGCAHPTLFMFGTYDKFQDQLEARFGEKDHDEMA